MNDIERLDLPSASSFAADVSCPGRQQLIRSIPATERFNEVPDAMALRGTRIHRALETGDVTQLLEDELDDFVKAVEHCSQAFEWWQSPPLGDGGKSEVKTVKEKRIWLHLGLDPVLSGQPDIVYVARSQALVLDLKSGFNVHLTSSERNWQLRVLAALVAREYNVCGVTVGFVKPKSRHNPVDMTFYGPRELDIAEQQIFTALSAMKESGASRRPGNHCRYCIGMLSGRCPEAASMALLPTVAAQTALGMSKADVERQVERLHPADWKAIWQRASIIRNILDAAGANLKKLSDADLADLGLQRKEGRRLDPIVNSVGLYKALEHTLTPEQLWSALEFSKSALVEAVKLAKGITKKEAEIFVREICEPFVEKKNAEASLEEK